MLLGAIFVLSSYQANYSVSSVIIIITIIFLLDGLDGIIARKLKTTSLFGSFLDIFGDRLIEFVFILKLFTAGLLPAWFPTLFYGRILLTDFCRIAAYGEDRVPPSGILLPKQLSGIVLSKASRSLYGFMKMIFFINGFLVIYTTQSRLHIEILLPFSYLILVMSAIRAFPILHSYLPLAISKLRNRLENFRLKTDLAFPRVFNQWQARPSRRPASRMQILQIVQVLTDLLAVSTFVLYRVF